MHTRRSDPVQVRRASTPTMLPVQIHAPTTDARRGPQTHTHMDGCHTQSQREPPKCTRSEGSVTREAPVQMHAPTPSCTRMAHNGDPVPGAPLNTHVVILHLGLLTLPRLPSPAHSQSVLNMPRNARRPWAHARCRHGQTVLSSPHRTLMPLSLYLREGGKFTCQYDKRLNVTK